MRNVAANSPDGIALSILAAEAEFWLNELEQANRDVAAMRGHANTQELTEARHYADQCMINCEAVREQIAKF